MHWYLIQIASYVVTMHVKNHKFCLCLYLDYCAFFFIYSSDVRSCTMLNGFLIKKTVKEKLDVCVLLPVTSTIVGVVFLVLRFTWVQRRGVGY